MNFFDEILFVKHLMVFDTNEIDEPNCAKKSLHYCLINHSFCKCKLRYWKDGL